VRELPTATEQHWLLVSMAALIKARGYEHLLTNPIVLPTRQYLPDKWSYSPKGLDRVVRRQAYPQWHAPRPGSRPNGFGAGGYE
jgi:hypothetical protein